MVSHWDIILGMTSKVVGEGGGQTWLSSLNKVNFSFFLNQLLIPSPSIFSQLKMGGSHEFLMWPLSYMDFIVYQASIV